MNNVTNAEARMLSVQGQTPLAIPLTYRHFERKALLPAFGSQAREISLRGLYRNPHNTLIQGAFGGLTSKIISTPYQVKGPTQADSENAQAMLINAHFGRGFEYLFSVTALNYLRHDRGVWWELIGYGDPDGPLVGSPVAVSVLDPLRCYPTGDPEYPVWYYSRDGKIHRLHESRVVHFVDMPDGDDDHPDVGLCALSRAVAIADREILMGRYIITRLDDKPKPGMRLFKNIDETQYDNMLTRYLNKRQTNDPDDPFGQVFDIFGVDPHEETGVEYVAYSEAPEKFDFIAYVGLDVKALALAIGVDIQELWELTGGGIGTGTQSKILHAKSQGKTFGKLLKAFERALNLRTLPPQCEFNWQYRDPQEDAELAQTASTWATTVTTVGEDLNKRERRQLLANQIGAFRDVLLDEQGQVRLPDDDIAPAVPDDSQTEDDENPQAEDATNAQPQLLTLARKAFGDTASEFADNFALLVNLARDGSINRRSLGIRLRGQLRTLGEQSYRDGLAAGGVEDAELNDDDQAAIQSWLADQSSYVSDFSAEVTKDGLTDTEVISRAQLWVNKSLSPIYHQGIAAADRNGLYEWGLGKTEKHCVTCLRLNGQKHRMRDWVAYGLLPKASTLVCGGWNCDCALQKTTGRAQGNLRSVRYVRTRKQRRAERRIPLWRRLLRIA
jgi:hypothetical protein